MPLKDFQDARHRQRSKAKILLSMIESDGQEHYSVMAMPDSYSAAHDKALYAFYTQLGKAVNFPENIILKITMKSASGSVVWATIDPESWLEIVEDGCEVRVEITGDIERLMRLREADLIFQ
ncbi:hypothetical protein M413DRAFT_439056 [Hebeloma cylindrosporum]|uniref:Uncharacterized protein n=1 Tax=Hebeloma cylindrosporum TaxID=76867 RepID=A0A0C3D1C5_HEBCY|nr:hypothetical protein M413DRAFT_439056 [Hebeloma cylindrosporum h7]